MKNRLSHSSHGFARSRFIILIMFAMIAAGLANPLCSQTNKRLDTKYGRGRGGLYKNSVNGTGIFAGMYRKEGHAVEFERRLTPKLDEFDSIVWFPNRYSPPDEKTIARIEKWLSDPWSSRTLIYVDRDFDAEWLYWKKALESAPAAEKPKIKSRIEFLEAKNAEARRLSDGVDRNRCSWFEIEERLEPKRCRRFTGELARLINPRRSEIYLTARHKIPVASRFQATVLLSANQLPLITVLTSWQHDGQVIIVHNGSMLLNLALVNSENRIIAKELVDRCDWGKVMFLESDEAAPTISNSSAAQRNTLWIWASEEPLCYILPHMVILGLIFCFVYYPIFGRAKRLSSGANTDFASHIQATAKLLARSTGRNEAQQKVNVAIQMVGRPDKQKPGNKK